MKHVEQGTRHKLYLDRQLLNVPLQLADTPLPLRRLALQILDLVLFCFGLLHLEQALREKELIGI